MKCKIIEDVEKIVLISNNSECIPSEPVLVSKDVFIITDKMEYGKGEPVGIILKNRLPRPIRYWQNSTWYEIRRLEYERGIPARWVPVRTYSPCFCGAECGSAGFLTMEPESEMQTFWDQKEGCEKNQVPAGEYRVSAKVKINGRIKTVSYEFRIR